MHFYLCNICAMGWQRCAGSLQHTATHCNTLQYTAAQCSALQHPATLCNTQQHPATPCDTLQQQNKTYVIHMMQAPCMPRNLLQKSPTKTRLFCRRDMSSKISKNEGGYKWLPPYMQVGSSLHIPTAYRCLSAYHESLPLCISLPLNSMQRGCLSAYAESLPLCTYILKGEGEIKMVASLYIHKGERDCLSAHSDCTCRCLFACPVVTSLHIYP